MCQDQKQKKYCQKYRQRNSEDPKIINLDLSSQKDEKVEVVDFIEADKKSSGTISLLKDEDEEILQTSQIEINFIETEKTEFKAINTQ